LSLFTHLFFDPQIHQAVNLGQGFPNFPAPTFIKQAATKAIENDFNHYPL
jgi:aspartate/methionine/tyrosine aminotransferase